MRRLACLALLGAVAALAGAGASGGTTPTRRYVDPLGWSLTYPRTLHLERAHSEGQVDVTVTETTLASFPLVDPIQIGQNATSAWLKIAPPRDPQGGFPADGIAVRVLLQEGGPALDLQQPESRFPILPSSFRRSTEYSHTRPRARERGVTADGRNYSFQIWIGPQASRSARRELARIVSSLRFPRLRDGETIANGFGVYRLAKRYPIGSFTRPSGEPFHLVHAPGGFYAVGWTWQTLSGGYKSRCRLRFDGVRKQFFCTNTRARWDRVGRVLVKPSGAKRGDPLNLLVAKLSWDGHVLVGPDAASFASASLARRLWPAVSRR